MKDTSQMDSVEIINYLTECTLATIEHMLLKSKTPKGELQRQINIAQHGVNHIHSRAYATTGRVLEVIQNHRCSVLEWSETWTRLKCKKCGHTVQEPTTPR